MAQIYGNGLQMTLDVAIELLRLKLCVESARKVIAALDTVQKRAVLNVQLAAVVDGGKTAVQTTFLLETNSPGGAFIARSVLAQLRASIKDDAPLPLVRAAAAAAAAEVATASAKVQASAFVSAASPSAAAGEDAVGGAAHDDTPECAEFRRVQAAHVGLETAEAKLRQRSEAEGAVLVVGAVVDGRVQARCRQDAVVKEVCIDHDGRATYTLENIKTKNVYVACEGEVMPKAASRRAAKLAEETAEDHAKAQLGRLQDLARAALATAASAKALATAAKVWEEARAGAAPDVNVAKVAKGDLRTEEEFFEYGRSCLSGGRQYAKKRFVRGAAITGHGKQQVIAGLDAIDALDAAGLFDVTYLAERAEKVGIAGIKTEMNGLLKFLFVKPELLEAAKEELPLLIAYVREHNELPEVDVADERVMMGCSTKKKAAARVRIEARRAAAAAKAATVEPVVAPEASASEASEASEASAEASALGADASEASARGSEASALGADASEASARGSEASEAGEAAAPQFRCTATKCLLPSLRPLDCPRCKAPLAVHHGCLDPDFRLLGVERTQSLPCLACAKAAAGLVRQPSAAPASVDSHVRHVGATPEGSPEDVLPPPAIDETIDVTIQMLLDDGNPDAVLNGLKKEQTSVVERSHAIVEWWRLPLCAGEEPRHVKFPAWGLMLRKIALCSPSSAAAERIFSLLKVCLREQRTNTLTDSVEASMLLHRNDYDV